MLYIQPCYGRIRGIMIGKPTILRHQSCRWMLGGQFDRCINSECDNHVSCKICLQFCISISATASACSICMEL